MFEISGSYNDDSDRSDRPSYNKRPESACSNAIALSEIKYEIRDLKLLIEQNSRNEYIFSTTPTPTK